MNSPDTERLFIAIQNQSQILHEQGVQLATIAQHQKDTAERLFGVGNTPGLFSVVMSHNKQLGYMKGAAGILTLFWSGAIAILAAMIKGHR